MKEERKSILEMRSIGFLNSNRTTDENITTAGKKEEIVEFAFRFVLFLISRSRETSFEEEEKAVSYQMKKSTMHT